MRKGLIIGFVFAAGLAAGWVLHTPKKATASGSVPESLRVTPPGGEPRELGVMFSQDGEGFGPVTWRTKPGDRPTWRVGLSYPGGRKVTLVAAETPAE